MPYDKAMNSIRTTTSSLHLCHCSATREQDSADYIWHALVRGASLLLYVSAVVVVACDTISYFMWGRTNLDMRQSGTPSSWQAYLILSTYLVNHPRLEEHGFSRVFVVDAKRRVHLLQHVAVAR